MAIQMGRFLALLALVPLALGQGPTTKPWSSTPLSRLSQRFKMGSPTAAACPPPGFDSVKNFDVRRYISAPWYVQEQMPLTYQPVDQLFCVRAKYEPFNPSNPLEGLKVNNYANRGRVNGPAVGTGPGQIVASIPNPQTPSKLAVGFALPGSTRPVMDGAYWVVALDPNYQWAIVTGGAPEVATEAGCMTASPRAGRVEVNDVGFWLFSRKPVDPEGTAIMKAEARRLGLDLSPLKKVQQEGCTYAGATP